MRRKIAPLIFCVLLFSCTKSLDLSLESSDMISEDVESYARLNFENEFSLERAIRTGEFSDLNATTKSASTKKFVSMLSRMPTLKSSDVEFATFYDSLGYDTLIPNLKFAALLSPMGELEVGNEVIRITPKGTYRFSRAHENEFLEFIEQDLDYEGEYIANNVYSISENIILYKTFLKDTTSLKYS